VVRVLFGKALIEYNVSALHPVREVSGPGAVRVLAPRLSI
jgi:hypothetical protein